MTERVYFHYEQLEEYRKGMWRIVRGERRKEFASKAAELMRDPDRFKTEMMRALTEWPNSVAHNLTAEGVNKIAWLGHAGCCLGVGSSEENTRIGWHMLTPEEQAEANRVAGEVLEQWEKQLVSERQGVLFGA